MSQRTRPTPPWLVVLLCLPLIACQALRGGTPSTQDPSPAVAEVGGQPITLDELDAFVKEELLERESRGGAAARLYELRDGALDRLMQRRALELAAEEAGTDVDSLIGQVAAEMGAPTDAEITTFYQQNRTRLPDASFEELRPSIVAYLAQQRPLAAVQKIAAEMDTRRWLEPPRLDVEAIGPALGPANAPVTIVEFSDFQCPYCRRAGPVVKAVADRFPDTVRVVYRHLPLDFHDRARAAAEASACADEQGGFWPYHDLVFENPKALADEDLRGYASDVGMDADALSACLEAGRGRAVVDSDLAAARSIGVTGTPAFIINGILISGLQPPEAFDRIIRAELERLQEDAS